MLSRLIVDLTFVTYRLAAMQRYQLEKLPTLHTSDLTAQHVLRLADELETFAATLEK